MKKSKGKIRNIHSYQKPENAKMIKDDKELDQVFRDDFIREGRKEAWRLNQQQDDDDLDDGTAILEKMIEQFRARGEWNDEEAAREDMPEFDGEEYEEDEKSIESDEPEEKEKLEIEEKPDIEKQFSQEELLSLLSEENRLALKRGQYEMQQDEKWRKRARVMKKAVIPAVIALVLFTTTMSSEADREHVMNVITTITDGGQNIYISKSTDDNEIQSQEEKDTELIKEKLGIRAPQLSYKPEGMKYEGCEIDQEFRNAEMNFNLTSGSLFRVTMDKGATDSEAVVAIDGVALEQFQVSIESIEMDVVIQKLEAGDTEVYKTHFIYDDTLYIFTGKMSQEEFKNIIKKIFF